jgi:GNAT superfamily N-acetyltransferase
MREARKGKDEAQIARILSECFGPVTPRQLSRWLDKPDIKDFICEVEGETVSHIDIEFKDLHLGEGVYLRTGGIGGVCTCSDYRRKGIMTDIMQQTLGYIKNTGGSNSALYTGLMLPAHRIYERSGFCDVQTWPFYLKILDFSYVFRLWLRDLKRGVKASRIAQKTLHDWNRTVMFHFEEFGVQSIRFSHGHLQRMHKPPKNADIVIAASLETLFRIMWGEIGFEDARKAGKIQVEHGTEADLQMLRKILIRIWDE